ncbi:site-specific integrase [Eubacteriales bacterium OttesenSCG-928-A19]|nr:site-specific integrase [Eubacteriales bacterium OttesenSCG-928-A19]
MTQAEINPLTLEEQRLLLAHLPDTTAGRALAFFLRTGLRASELCGLQWGDIDADSFHVQRSAQYVSIPKDQQVDSVKCILDIESTKTRSSNRHIPLTDAVRSILEAQRVAQIRQRLVVGVLWNCGTPGQGECYVFATRVGTVMDRNNLSRTLRAALKKAGIESRGVHALRHTFATNGIIHVKNANVHTISKILGHRKVAFTMQQYVHSDLDTKRASMQAIDSLI